MTGHLKETKDFVSADLDWVALTRPRQTVVIYMGLSGLSDICRQLIAHGAAADFPIAIVQDGTIASQKVMVGTLTDLPDRVKTSGFTSPCLIVIGEVVKLHHELAWYPAT